LANRRPEKEICGKTRKNEHSGQCGNFCWTREQNPTAIYRLLGEEEEEDDAEIRGWEQIRFQARTHHLCSYPVHTISIVWSFTREPEDGEVFCVFLVQS
jgi:hypothetical protein